MLHVPVTYKRKYFYYLVDICFEPLSQYLLSLIVYYFYSVTSIEFWDRNPNWSRRLPSTSYLVHFSLILTFDSILSKLPTISLNKL
jgi:hypothetical protein